MKTNQDGIELIKRFEGLRLNAYQDVADIWTIGYGHTGPEVKPGLTITEAQADALLCDDLLHFERGVQDVVKVSLNANEFSALVSFSYNLGLGSLRKSTLLRLLNENDRSRAAMQFTLWDKSGVKSLPGLHKRRLAEQKLFETPVSA